MGACNRADGSGSSQLGKSHFNNVYVYVCVSVGGYKRARAPCMHLRGMRKKDKGQEVRLTEEKRKRAGRERRPGDAGDRAQLLYRRLLQAQAQGHERAAERPRGSPWAPPAGPHPAEVADGRPPPPRNSQFAESPASLCAPPPRTAQGSRRETRLGRPMPAGRSGEAGGGRCPLEGPCRDPRSDAGPREASRPPRASPFP